MVDMSGHTADEYPEIFKNAQEQCERTVGRILPTEDTPYKPGFR